MQKRKLGRTGLEVGVIGLGTEYLVGQSRDTVASVVRRAVEAGVNYMDVLFAYHEYLDNMGAALEGLRQEVYIAGHLGNGEENGQYRQTRDLAECEVLFEDLLRRLQTDHVDVVMLSNCDKQDDYEQVISTDGLLGLAQRLKREGKAKYIGFSGHKVPVSRLAVESGRIDVLMHNVNFTRDADGERRRLYELASTKGVAVVAMKPFAGGSLLEETGKKKVTPVQCINYAVSQPGVATVVPGVKSVEELEASLAWTSAPAEKCDYSDVIVHYQKVSSGRCVYCNHCLPCPANIDIGATTKLLVSARGGVTSALAEMYESLPVKPSECIKCGECVLRCPFDVDARANMAQAVELFEGSSQER